MRHIILACALICASGANAHDFTKENAKFQEIAANKDMTSRSASKPRRPGARECRNRAGRCAYAAEIRSLTNDAFKAVGGQPAFLASEIKRLEEAIANPKDPSGVATAKALLEKIKAEKAAYDVIDKSAGEEYAQGARADREGAVQILIGAASACSELVPNLEETGHEPVGKNRADPRRMGDEKRLEVRGGSKGLTTSPRWANPLAFTDTAFANPIRRLPARGAHSFRNTVSTARCAALLRFAQTLRSCLCTYGIRWRERNERERRARASDR